MDKAKLGRILRETRAKCDAAQEASAWTAVSTLTRQVIALEKEVDALEEEDVSPLTDDELRALILDLEDDQVKVAASALAERRKAGK